MNAIVQSEQAATQLEKVLIGGDLSALTADQRVQYYNAVCDSVRLNPLTRPFQYITFDGKLQLYASKGCADQLRTVHSIDLTITGKEIVGDLYVVTAHATGVGGREDEDIGAVNINGLKGQFLANAMKKAVTQAKRRVTLSICGLGLPDEEDVPSEDETARRAAKRKQHADVSADQVRTAIARNGNGDAPESGNAGETVETELQTLQRRAEAIAQKRGTVDLSAWFEDELTKDERKLLASDSATWKAIKDAAAATDKQPLLSVTA